MTLLQIASLLIVLAGAFGAINYLFLKLPSSIGILVIALIASFVVIVTDALFPSLTVEEQIRAQVLELEFSEALLGGMLGLLRFWVCCVKRIYRNHWKPKFRVIVCLMTVLAMWCFWFLLGWHSQVRTTTQRAFGQRSCCSCKKPLVALRCAGPCLGMADIPCDAFD